jgi:glycosyltransferase involved in cell wall biosynthesis
MKWGLPLFIYRDLTAFAEKGHTLKLFMIHNKPGLYNPRPGWPVVPVRWLHLMLSQLRFVLRDFAAYRRLFAEARRTGSLIDLFIAVSFVEQMRDRDVIHVAFGDHKLFVGYYCKRILNIPLVVTVHAYELYNNPNPTMFVEALKHCDTIITVSEHNKNILAQEYGAPADRIKVVYHIVDLDAFKYKPKVKLLIVGFFTEKKGHAVLFEALKALNRDDVELWVVGDNTPGARVDCRSLAKEAGVEAQVVFFGAQSGNALRALFRECDVLVAPSHTAADGDQEGLPTVLAEAMAFGKPVVATRHAGIPEVIDEILVDEKNVEQLAEALRTLCDSAELRRKLGARNRAAAERIFSPANNDEVEAILLGHVQAGAVD